MKKIKTNNSEQAMQGLKNRWNSKIDLRAISKVTESLSISQQNQVTQKKKETEKELYEQNTNQQYQSPPMT